MQNDVKLRRKLRDRIVFALSRYYLIKYPNKANIVGGLGLILDMRTIYVLAGITCIMLGSLQLLTYTADRVERWQTLWGLSNVFLGIGLFSSALRDFVPNFFAIGLGNAATLIGYSMLLVGMRRFAGFASPWRHPAIYFTMAAVVIQFYWREVEDYQPRIAIISIACMLCDLSIIYYGLQIARRERLASAKMVVGVFAPTTALFAGRAVLGLIGRLGGADMFSKSYTGPGAWIIATATTFIMLRGVALLSMASERSRNRLRDNARQDPLTGALNRSGLAHAFARLGRKRANRRPSQVTALVIDIDHFKQLNDTHGHAAGDQILQLLVQIADERLRVGDIFARLGGDEFVAILPGATSAQALDVANRIRELFSEQIAGRNDLKVRPTLSIGAAAELVISDGLEHLLREADRALYQAKAAGRDRVSATWAREEVGVRGSSS